MKIKNISLAAAFPSLSLSLSLSLLLPFFWSIKIPLEINTQRTKHSLMARTKNKKGEEHKKKKTKMVERKAMRKNLIFRPFYRTMNRSICTQCRTIKYIVRILDEKFNRNECDAHRLRVARSTLSSFPSSSET